MYIDIYYITFSFTWLNADLKAIPTPDFARIISIASESPSMDYMEYSKKLCTIMEKLQQEAKDWNMRGDKQHEYSLVSPRVTVSVLQNSINKIMSENEYDKAEYTFIV